MKATPVVLTLAGFAAGLIAGAVFFRNPATTQSSVVPGQTTPTKIIGPTSSFFRPSTPSTPGTSSTRGTASSTASPGGKPTGTVAELEAVLRTTSFADDQSRLYQMLEGLDPSQYGVALTACIKSGTSGSQQAVRAIAMRWGRTDSQGALAFAETITNMAQRNQVAVGILGGWAEATRPPPPSGPRSWLPALCATKR